MPITECSTSPAKPVIDVPFHRIARCLPNYRWWRPLTSAVTALMVFCVLLLAAVAVLVIAGIFMPAVSTTVDRALSTDADLREPGQLAFLLGTVCLLWPAAALGVRWGGGRPIGTLSSISGRLRWNLFPKMLALAAVLFTITNAASLLFPAAGGVSDSVIPVGHGPGGTWMLLVVVLAVVPVQAAAEEYAFRGLLMQTVGSWLRHPAFAILVPVPLFVLGHDYGVVGQIDVAAFAVAAGWITWRTGGLEAAIALHVVNNVGVMGLGAVGLADPNATDVPWAALPFSLAFLLAYSLIASRRFSVPVAPATRYLASA